MIHHVGLATDLYELTMAQSYLEHGKTGRAVFSLFVRKLPERRNFLVSAGLETLMGLLEKFRFGDTELRYLRSLGIFKDWFLDYLREYDPFRCQFYALPEGTIFFHNEPVLQVEGSLPDAQILETLVMNVIHFETLVASKAVRSYLVAGGKVLIDFGLRRSHSPLAGLLAARASYLAGFMGTSNLQAGMLYGIPVLGTMAHSFVMVFEDEEEAFRAFAESFPDRTVLLIDTYDTLEGAKKAIKLMKEGIKVVGVRIDSGDIAQLCWEVRDLLDREGFSHVKIVVSGGVDEEDIERWVSQNVPIDILGVGTKMVVSADAPYLDIAYKLVEYEGKPKFKLSPGKATFPYKRQIVREKEGGFFVKDRVIRYTEEGLVQKVRLPVPSLKEARERLMEQLSQLPPALRSLQKAQYPVEIE
ncbi:nicotinate phosphoribosyltransferase [Thermocrinis albus DSM 14484]|uniref:Nicotinate phosphoribosyltransferase n=1 Tax=Thermocrinis albus (strain DSM 14484 / JCM 11386 / HI 11/12) TaxID=638303 RepID=D3SQ69_THEAH|nr:nicotinate phosphoribosyltransferase [Thermocrinis albus]ADC89306.1 nicotinate phosphoribosyltransferase [Thermocrinis albus DSM 14484]